MIGSKKFRDLLEQSESRHLEYKEAFPKGGQIAKTVIAFANGSGGKIVFGIRNKPRDIIGLSDEEIPKIEERVANSIFGLCYPIIIPEIYLKTAEGRKLLVVEIFPGTQKPYFLKSKGKIKGTYIRLGSTNKQASWDLIEELERQKRNISFDATAVYEIPWNRVNLKSFILRFQKNSRFKFKNEYFENLGLLLKRRNRSYPSVAAILLSDSFHRAKLFPYSKVECARFKGEEPKMFLDQKTLNLPVHLLPEATINFIKKHINVGSKFGEIYREDRWEYPMEAIREAVINAIIHRDYSITGTDIKVAVYDARIEITSPGTLPGTISLDDLGTGRSEIRNRVLAPIFKKLGLIEAWGTGIRKIFNSLKEYPEIEVDFREAGYAFQIQFRKKSKLEISHILHGHHIEVKN